MNLSAPFIERPVMTTLVMLTLIWLGIMAYYVLPVANLPDVDYPTINVNVIFPGASPVTMANTVATPLEKQFLTIPGITNVTSTNTLGKTSIVLEFEISKHIDSAAQDVQAAISIAKKDLPPDLPNDPTYQKVNPSGTPILYISLTSSTMSVQNLYTLANTSIGQRISTVEGVAQVFTYGSPFAVRIQIDPSKIASKGITISDVAEAVSNANQSLPAGQLDGLFQSYIIQPEGQLYKAHEYNELIAAYVDNAPVRIKDIGNAIDSQQNDRQVTLYVDKSQILPTVVLAVQRQPGANTVQVSDKILAFLHERKSNLPGSVNMEIFFDRSKSIREAVFDVKLTLFVAFVLVILVILIYLGNVRDTLIPSAILPISIIGTFPFMYLFGYTIDSLSLLALTLAVGFIIDDAIVVLENIFRRVEAGESPKIASIEGSRQISITILSMTLSLVAVFIPLLFLGGLIGKIFKEFAITLTIVTILSGAISLSLTPMLCSLYLRPRDENKKSLLTRLSLFVNERTLGLYRPILFWMIRNRVVALTIGVLSIVLTAFFFKILPTDFIPDDDIGFIIGYSRGAEGTSSLKMAEYQKKYIDVVQKDSNVDSLISISSFTSYREGISFIKLKPYDQRGSSQKVIQELSQKVNAIPGLSTFFKNVPLIDLSIGASNKGPYQYTLQSLNTENLYKSAEELLGRLNTEELFQGITSDMEVKTPQLNVKILRDQASRLGVDVKDIEEALLLSYSGNRVTRIQTPIDQYDVIVELDRKDQESVKSLEKIYVRNKNQDTLVPLHSVIEWNEGLGLNSVNHISQFPSVTITFSVKPGVPLGDALARFKEVVNEVVDRDVLGSVKGTAETFEQAIHQAGFLLIFAVIAIYIVLGILYESFIHPVTILSTLPPAALGALLTLYLLNMPLSLYAYLGIILLIGIVKKNGIMMVDFALDFLRQGKKPEEAIVSASLVRFRPIMMTTFAAIFGALPIAFGWGTGAEARRPLGIVIIGGLLFSQMITLFLTPVVYLFFENLRERRKNKY